MWWYHLFAWCVNTKKCTHFGIVTVEGELLILMMLSITKKCLWKSLFRIATSLDYELPRNQAHHSNWDLVCDPRQQFPAWSPNQLCRCSSEWFRTVSKSHISPSEDTYCQSYLSKTHLDHALQSGSWLYRELSLSFFSQIFKTLYNMYSPPSLQFCYPRTQNALFPYWWWVPFTEPLLCA